MSIHGAIHYIVVDYSRPERDFISCDGVRKASAAAPGVDNDVAL